jgi:hypothetical protein
MFKAVIIMIVIFVAKAILKLRVTRPVPLTALAVTVFKKDKRIPFVAPQVNPVVLPMYLARPKSVFTMKIANVQQTKLVS